VSQVFLARWYIGGGYTDVSEVVVFTIVAKLIIYIHSYTLLRRGTFNSMCLIQPTTNLVESLQYAPTL